MTPIYKPAVNSSLDQMNGLQRAAESFRYVLFCAEHWISPNGTIRSWLRLNICAGSSLLIPALIVMPVVDLILWELGSIFTGIIGKIILTVLILTIPRLIKRRSIFPSGNTPR